MVFLIVITEHRQLQLMIFTEGQIMLLSTYPRNYSYECV